MAQTITGAQAQYSAFATAAPSRTRVATGNQLGLGLATESFSDADIVYSFSVTATGNTDVATLTYSSGAVAQTTGTPTIADAAVNQEGGSLVTLVNAYAVLVKQTVAGDITLTGSGINNDEMSAVGDTVLGVWPSGFTVGSSTLVINLATIGAALEVTVIGKSS